MKLCHLDDLVPGTARGFQAGDCRVLLVRGSTGAVHAYLNRCPHLGVPLNWEDDAFMDAEGAFLRCATHGALFEPDSGLCILGPCRGESLWQLETEVRDDCVWIDENELPPPTDRLL